MGAPMSTEGQASGCAPLITDEEFDRVVNTSSTGKRAAVFMALGAASGCWGDLASAGVFQDERARRIGDDLIRYLGIEP